MKRNTMKKGFLFLVLVCCLGFGVSQMQSTPAQAAKKTSTKKKTKKKTGKKKSLKKAKITLSKKTYTYTGKAKKPSVTVKYGKKKLKKNKDYTVKYTSNKKAGTAKVTVTAKSGKTKLYKGKKTAKYTIKKAASGIALDRSEYTAVEGDGAFNIVAKPTKGAGKITYSCATTKTNVIKVTSAGKVTVVKQGTATVNMTLAETANYYGASASVKVTVSKKKITVDSASSIQNFDYATQVKAAQKEYTSISKTAIKKLTDYTYTIITKYAIPGLAPTADDDLTKGYIQCKNLCPQGFYFAGDYLLTTAYCMDDIHNSCIFIYNKNSGAYLRTIVLDQKSHVGGVAYDGENVWICHAGDKALECISYKELKNYASGKQGMVARNTVTLKAIDIKPSAVTYNEADGRLWVAEYVSLPKYKDEKKIPYMAAYQYEDGELVPAYDMIYNKEPEEDYLSITTADGTITMDDADQTVVSGAAIQTVAEEKEIQTNEDKDYRLEVGDLITEINGYPITGRESLKAALKNFGDQGGQNVAITIIRKVEAKKVTEKDTYVTITGKIKLGEYGEKVYVDEIEIPNRVQGLCFNGDGSKLILSRSVGRNTTKPSYISELVVYDWEKFDRTKPELVIEVPPMVEQINYDSQSRELYMLFESAATTYLEGTDNDGNSMSPIDKLISLKIIL